MNKVPRAGSVAAEGADELKGIQEVARELGITHRTLRFYEDKGLISPQRIGTMRIYSKRDMGRMRLILRGKRLGFSIREIGEFLDMYDADPTQHAQMEALLKSVREKRQDLRHQKKAIDETLGELDQIVRDIEAYLRAT
ncbi:MerR family transcriptional regulator [Tsuneonella sp. HG222]